MRTRILTLASALVLMISCNKKEENKKPMETAAPEATALMNSKACYSYVKNKDTILMTLAMSANNANGELTYNLYQKDKNTGTFSGTFIGDTLYAEYHYESEGMPSVRETIFLRNGDALTEGFGDMEEKDGKMVFKNPKNAAFSNHGIVLIKGNCN